MKLQENTNKEFLSALYALPEDISSVLKRLPIFVQSGVWEIRLRAGGPVTLTGKTCFFVTQDAVATTYLPQNALTAEVYHLEEVVKRITGRSVYTREQELKCGFLSMKKGHRAGVCGVFSEGSALKVTSINIRIAREVKGCADSLVPYAYNGMLIAGPPGSGKTTLLRDLIRTLSDGGARVCVIDQRGELGGSGSLDLGVNTDLICGVDKATGVENALRSMFPQYIAFDEIGSGGELTPVRESFFSGVKLLTTAHAADLPDLKARGVTSALLDCRIGCIALLSSEQMGRVSLYTPEEVKSLVG